MKSSISLAVVLLIMSASCTSSSTPTNVESPAGASLGRSVNSSESTEESIDAKGNRHPDFAASQRYVYFDQGHERAIWRDPNLVAEFHPSGSGRNALLAASPDGVEVPTGQTNTRLWRIGGGLDIDQLVRGLNMTSRVGTQFSPVFHDTACETSPVRALPGGVVVQFPADWDEVRCRAWASTRGLAFQSTVVPGKNLALLDTPPGIESLEIANRLSAEGEVLHSKPNWWTSVSKR